MGPFTLFYTALVGFFAFGALYHLILWWSYRREILLAVFSAECLIHAANSAVIVALATASTPSASEAAYHVRIALGLLIIVTWLWSQTLVSETRPGRFVWTLTGIFLFLFVRHVFIQSLHPPVESVEQSIMPWGEVVFVGQLARQGWLFIPVYGLTFVVVFFGFGCGLRLYSKDKVAGTLVLIGGLCIASTLAVQFLKRFGLLSSYPNFGTIAQMFWVVAFAYLIARRHKQIREQLIESQQRIRGVFDQTFQFIGLMTTDGKLIEANRTALEFAGIKEEDVLGKPFWQTVWWQHSPELQQRLREAIAESASGKMVQFEATHPRTDGSLAYIDFSLKPLFNESGQVMWLIPESWDITEHRRIEEELRTSRQRLEALSRQLISTQETERRHLACELHDEIGQVLTAIKMNLRRTQRAANVDLKSHLEENVAMVDQAIVQVRNLSLSLRPPQLDQLGLVAALHWLLKQQAELGLFANELHADLGGNLIQKDLEVVCFRIVQEALTNAVRHGKPSKVNVRLQAIGNELHVSVQDDGIGFHVGDCRQRALKGDSIGLISMEERASLVGGHFEIESTPNHGTKIRAIFPLSQSRKAS